MTTDKQHIKARVRMLSRGVACCWQCASHTLLHMLCVPFLHCSGTRGMRFKAAFGSGLLERQEMAPYVKIEGSVSAVYIQLMAKSTTCIRELWSGVRELAKLPSMYVYRATLRKAMLSLKHMKHKQQQERGLCPVLLLRHRWHSHMPRLHQVWPCLSTVRNPCAPCGSL